MLNKDLTLGKIDSYELIDSGEEKKFERFGEYTIIRPEKQALWKKSKPELWDKIDAEYIRTNEKFGDWKTNKPLENWVFEYDVLKMALKPTPFGHVGVFPELSSQWDWIAKNCHTETPPKVLSLFSYTGGATLAAAGCDAQVTHVDASKPAISWAVENQKLSGFESKKIRWIIDDALKFVKREERRGSFYDGIVMDPPKFGRGPKGEVWQFEKDFPELLDACSKILSPNPLFFLVTAYTVPISPITLANMVSEIVPASKNIEFGEIAIEEYASKRLLPTSIYARWSR